MVKIVYIGRFRDDIDPEMARNWWKDEHGAMAMRCPKLRRYVHNYFSANERNAVGFDGFVELWFDTVADFEETTASVEWAKLGQNGGDIFATVVGGIVTEHILQS